MAEDLNKKIQDYLDGNGPRPTLNADEARKLADHDAIIREAGQLYRSVDIPDLTTRVAAQITASDAPYQRRGAGRRLHQMWDWLWEPQTLRVRPAFAALPAAAFALFFVVLSQTSDAPAPTDGQPPPAATARIFVQFRLDAPQASDVHLVGTFTDWKPSYAMRETSPGVWSVVVPLEPGVHDYAFLVNGKWTIDPVAPVVDDGFGGANSRLLVIEPDTSSRL